MPPRPEPITDSPLFWLLLFGSAGLMLLSAVEPKFAVRQERIERMQQSRELGRQRNTPDAASGSGHRAAGLPIWQPARGATLRPLLLFLATLLAAAMVAVYIRQYRRQAACRPRSTAEREGNGA